jgi:FkbH-like protein
MINHRPLDNSDYIQMLRIGRSINDNARHLPELRLAVLADHASQQLSCVLKAALFEQGYYPIIYEADYATTPMDVYNRNSNFYQFGPDIIFLSLAVQKYRDRFLDEVTPQGREALPDTYLAETSGIVDTLSQAGRGVIVSNLALPIERMFGNYSALTRQSLYGSVLTFNSILAGAISVRKSCQLNDIMYLSNRVGAESFLDDRLWLTSKSLCVNRYLPEVARSVARAAGARNGKTTKCLVLDLDNTIWGGVVGDDGREGIRLGGDAYGEAFQHFQRYILSLKHRGYILAICSKNEAETALDCCRNHPEMILRENDFAIFVANWNDKASNVEYIARVLNIGLDSVVFIDDSSFERNLVRTALPAVVVPEMPEDIADYVRVLENSGLFETLGYTGEDYHRNQKYREEALRTNEQVKYSNIDEYLASLEMVIDCGPFKVEHLPRIAQLIQRSNQFNLCTQRLTEAACERYMLDNSRCATVSARLQDRFGDYGLISAICCEINDGLLKVKEFVMSCRVLKRGVEEYLMNYLFSECHRRGLVAVQGEYIRSPKNALVKDFYARFGFDLVSSDHSRQVWHLDVARYEPKQVSIQRVSQ